ncbi:ornithine cyclodeaminase family protein [Streptomyces paludis]|uniref:Ornithine cyclodeaminase family protein n=1 Tax=Streptomyces paludis TaxID=2282738 RepID=A0A345I2F7_9ACTN|nr:ornithine cyclodeaminase family protein [Streptomyces paludis]
MLRKVGRDAFMDEMMERLSDGFRALGEGRLATSPARSGFVRESNGTGVLEWMPHHAPGDSATLKVVGYTPSNAATSALPTIIGTVSRYDDATGRLTALADAVVLTALRTGAASALASSVLARRDSRVVGLIGTGAQAVSQLHALSRVFDIERVLVHDIDRDNADSFLIRSKFLGLDVRTAPPETIAAQADIICTATTTEVGAEPVFPDRDMLGHVHVNAIGADLPGKTELPVELLRRALVCPDHREQAVKEGECQRLAPEEIGPELATLIAEPERAEAARDTPTVFDSTGFALEDHIALDVLLGFAAQLGLGTAIEVEYHPSDALNPYPDEA